MGYTTDFKGSFAFSRPLSAQEAKYIRDFSGSRRMKRDVKVLNELYKGKHGLPNRVVITPEMEINIKFFTDLGIEVALTPTTDNRTPEQIYGVDGEYFANPGKDSGQSRDASIIDYNNPPGHISHSDFSKGWDLNQERIEKGEVGQPGLWCQWTVSKDNSRLEWDGGEKFYYYTYWLKYLIKHFFAPWGVELVGEVIWQGEEPGDVGKIVVVDNVVSVKRMQFV